MPGWMKLPLDILAVHGCTATEAIGYALLLDISAPVKDAEDIRKAQCRQAYIADKLGLSRRTVQRTLDSLEDKDLIGRTHTGRTDLYIVSVIK